MYSDPNHSLIIILGFIGFLIAFYIYKKKHKRKKLVCPMRSNCDKVVHSRYAKLFGVPLEVLGMLYYLFIFISYSLVCFFNIRDFNLLHGLFIVSTASVALSLYLSSLQIFVLRQWCFWCLSSAIISTLIAIFSYLSLIPS